MRRESEEGRRPRGTYTRILRNARLPSQSSVYRHGFICTNQAQGQPCIHTSRAPGTAAKTLVAGYDGAMLTDAVQGQSGHWPAAPGEGVSDGAVSCGSPPARPSHARVWMPDWRKSLGRGAAMHVHLIGQALQSPIQVQAVLGCKHETRQAKISSRRGASPSGRSCCGRLVRARLRSFSSGH